MKNRNSPQVLKLKSILVPCDFSACSRAALDYAVQLAPQYNASVTLLHVIEPVQPNFLMESSLSRQAQGKMRKKAEMELRKCAKVCVTSRVPCRVLVKPGKPWEVIVTFASRCAIDLIVMGTHGYSGLKHAYLGSVAERVVQHARCPVLTLRSANSSTC